MQCKKFKHRDVLLCHISGVLMSAMFHAQADQGNHRVILIFNSDIVFHSNFRWRGDRGYDSISQYQREQSGIKDENLSADIYSHTDKCDSRCPKLQHHLCVDSFHSNVIFSSIKAKPSKCMRD